MDKIDSIEDPGQMREGMDRTVIAFDLYGTILSTDSISRALAKLYGEGKGKAISALARRYQLEYTWRSNNMNMYRPFDVLTRFSFRQAAAEVGVELSLSHEEHIMDAYNMLEPFSEAYEAFKLVEANPHLDAYVFTNGTYAMAKSSLENCSGISEIASSVIHDDRILSVDALNTPPVYKPDRKVYQRFMDTSGGRHEPRRTWLVSSNPFDVVGAKVAGMYTIWVDRAGTGWTDGLGDALDMSPTIEVRNMGEAVQRILED